jgi:glycosyltransferase involved in cell wall biosynthesis
MSMCRIAFILEQTMGNKARSENLQAVVSTDTSIVANWNLVNWNKSRLALSIPLYRDNWTVHFAIEGIRAVSRAARYFRPDALYFRYDTVAMLATGWMRHIPSIILLDATPIQIHAMANIYGYTPPPKWLRYGLWKASRDSFLAAEALVTESQWAKKGLIDGYGIPADKIYVVPAGVDVKQFEVSNRQLKIKKPIKILMVGGDLKRKGGLLLCDAFRELRPLGVELHLVTHDYLPEEPGLFVYNDIAPNSPALKQLYEICDIFCLPTYADCSPLVLAEAGAAGMPTVSTHVAAIPEIIQEGQTGLLVPPGNLNALVTALRQLVEDHELSTQLGKQAVEMVNEKYNIRINTSLCLDLLKQKASERIARTGSRR